MYRIQSFLIILMITSFCLSETIGSESSFIGRWAFSLPDGRPVWLKVAQTETGYKGALLWSVGSARPVENLSIHKNAIQFSRRINWKPYGRGRGKLITAPIKGKMRDEELELQIRQQNSDDKTTIETFRLVGKRNPPLPPRPDLSKVRFGESIPLLRSGLEGWTLSDPEKVNGWSFRNGILVNETPKKDFGAYGSYGNLRTHLEFEDFELTIEYNVESGGNSGIYLRGMYEVQVVDRDSRMQGIQGPGAVFGRIKPSRNAASPPGSWNQYRLVLVDRHITVELNGEVVIDNQALEGCTGGGILADDTRPGPIFLQGDHTSVRYRNIFLRPVIDEKQ